MTLRQYIFMMCFATLLCWVAFGFVIVNVDPEHASFLEFFFFYVSLFLSLLGTVSLLLFGALIVRSRDDVALYRYVKKSFSFGCAVAFSWVLLLFLQSHGYLHYWNVVILGTLALFLLFFSISARRRSIANQS